MSISSQVEPENYSDYIFRHDTERDNEFYKELLENHEEYFQAGLDNLGKLPKNIHSMFRDALDTIPFRAALNPNDPLMQRDLFRAARCISAYSRMIQLRDGFITLDLGDGNIINLPPVEGHLNSSDIADGIYAAIICRDRTSLKALCQIDVRKFQSPNVLTSSYTFTWVEFLQAFVTKSNQTMEKLRQVYTESEPEKVETNVDYALYIASGLMEVFYNFGAQDRLSFYKALAKSLVRHKRYFEVVQLTSGETLRSEPRGYISLGLLSASVLYHDLGNPIDVQSDYIPKALVEGQFIDKELHWKAQGEMPLMNFDS